MISAYAKIGSRQLRLTHLDKVLYPKTGFSKRDLIHYYQRIAPVLLPHLYGRTLTLKRFPSGVDQESFFEKRCPSFRPNWVRTGRHEDIDYCLIEDLPSLIWIANLAAIELHPSLSLAEKNTEPTSLVFDLDPGTGADIRDCAKVAMRIRELLWKYGLQCFAKTSGLKGIQVYVPLNSGATYEQTKTFAHSVARILEQRHPNEVISRMSKKLRHSKVFIDWSQNDEHKTTICVYSLRAAQTPRVSMPLDWREVENLTKAKSLKTVEQLVVFSANEALDRVKQRGDLFLPVLRYRQALSGVNFED